MSLRDDEDGSAFKAEWNKVRHATHRHEEQVVAEPGWPERHGSFLTRSALYKAIHEFAKWFETRPR